MHFGYNIKLLLYDQRLAQCSLLCQQKLMIINTKTKEEIQMKLTLKKTLAIMLCMFTLISMVPMESHAANVCAQISGNSNQVKSFIVNTGSRWLANKDVIKISQTKGIMKKSSTTLTKINGSIEIFEEYTIRIQKLGKNNKVISTQTKTFSGNSISIKLDKNSKYRITMTPGYTEYLKTINSVSNGRNYYFDYNPYLTKLQLIFRSSKHQWVPRGWKKAATWKVTSTKGINVCSFSQ